jgi:hypothetical protein
MSRTSPGDLAVAFRSLDRRLREALRGEGEAAASEPVRELRAVVASAASELGVAAHGDLADTGEAIASAIEHIPADAWDIARLDRLRALALEAGRLLRVVAAATEGAD